MSELGGLWKHENHQHALVPPKTERVAAQVAEELTAVTYATPSYGGTQKKIFCCHAVPLPIVGVQWNNSSRVERRNQMEVFKHVNLGLIEKYPP